MAKQQTPKAVSVAQVVTAVTVQQCLTCRCYMPSANDKNQGECRRMPPVTDFPYRTGLAIFPNVTPSTWCYEYKPKQ